MHKKTTQNQCKNTVNKLKCLQKSPTLGIDQMTTTSSTAQSLDQPKLAVANFQSRKQTVSETKAGRLARIQHMIKQHKHHKNYNDDHESWCICIWNHLDHFLNLQWRPKQHDHLSWQPWMNERGTLVQWSNKEQAATAFMKDLRRMKLQSTPPELLASPNISQSPSIPPAASQVR